jgi:hypothetical protein
MFRCRIPGKSLDDLLTGLPGGGVLRDIEVHNPASVMCEDLTSTLLLKKVKNIR